MTRLRREHDAKEWFAPKKIQTLDLIVMLLMLRLFQRKMISTFYSIW
jgi:hypothetical protein